MTSYHYRLATDSCCDLTHTIIEELEVEVLEFPFTLDGAEHFDDLGVTMTAARFYDAMRAIRAHHRAGSDDELPVGILGSGRGRRPADLP